MVLFRDRFVNHKQLIEYGNAEISFVLSTLQQGVLLWLFIRDLFTIPGVWAVLFFPVVVVLKLVASWLFGRMWDRGSLISKEAKWSADRNPHLVEILSIVKELRDRR